MSKSSSLVLGETKVSRELVRGSTKGNVIKLRYILSGVGSRVIMGGAEVGCYESNRGCVMEIVEM